MKVWSWQGITVAYGCGVQNGKFGVQVCVRIAIVIMIIIKIMIIIIIIIIIIKG